MIAFSRVASIAPGQTVNALSFAKAVAAHAKATAGVDLVVSIACGGNPYRVRWSSQYDSLAALETAMSRMALDAKYVDLVAKGQDHLIAGSTFDEIWREI